MLVVPGHLSLAQLRQIARTREPLTLDPASAAPIAVIVRRGEPAYGVNTGFGRLATTHIPSDQLEVLQKNLVLSHAVGVGRPLSAPVVRLILALKVASLARGHSGVRAQVIDALLRLHGAD